MKIIVSPDSFKGSATAAELCEAIRKGIHRHVPHAEIVELPLSDGGEGLIDNIVYACKGTFVETSVQGPLGDPVTAKYGVIHRAKEETAIIEMAQASGLTLIPENRRNPLITSTYGTGQLIKHALDAGIRQFIIGLGGSATNDGGAGLVQALGVGLLDADRQSLPTGGQALRDLAHIDMSLMDHRLADCLFLVACDVTNPLCGAEGATYVFGPQKGATEPMLPILDQALAHYASILAKELGKEVANLPGAGAAGGTSASLVAFLDATLVSGIDVFLDTIDYDAAVTEADLIITGEGKLDGQTLSGKVIQGVCNRAAKQHVPVIALCGGTEVTAEQLQQIGLTAALSIVPGPCTLAEAMEHCLEWTELQAGQIIKLIHARPMGNQ